MTRNELFIVLAYLFSFTVMFVAIVRAYHGWNNANNGWERANAGWKKTNDLNATLVKRIEELEVEKLMRDIEADDVTVLRDINGRVLAIHANRRGQSREIYQA